MWDPTLTYDEEELPLPDDPTARGPLLVDQYTQTIGGANANWTLTTCTSTTSQGHALSKKVQAALGSDFPHRVRARDDPTRDEQFIGSTRARLGTQTPGTDIGRSAHGQRHVRMGLVIVRSRSTDGQNPTPSVRHA